MNAPEKHLNLSIAGVPHVVTEDDVYNGFLIPKGLYSFPGHRNHLIDVLLGAIVVPNSW